MEAMWAESDSRTPMICFLSMGSDPTENIERLAKSKGMRKFLVKRNAKVPNSKERISSKSKGMHKFQIQKNA